jgi:hypothetical protein
MKTPHAGAGSLSPRTPSEAFNVHWAWALTHGEFQSETIEAGLEREMQPIIKKPRPYVKESVSGYA